MNGKRIVILGLLVAGLLVQLPAQELLESYLAGAWLTVAGAEYSSITDRWMSNRGHLNGSRSFEVYTFNPDGTGWIEGPRTQKTPLLWSVAEPDTLVIVLVYGGQSSEFVYQVITVDQDTYVGVRLFPDGDDVWVTVKSRIVEQ